MFYPGQVWKDTDGNPIQAHGGGVNFFNGTYYWYGENKTGCSASMNGQPWHAGVNCYSSKNLTDWTFEGTVLPARPDDKEHDLSPFNIMDRPHVLFNASTGKYVILIHGPWTTHGNPCVGRKAETSFDSQFSCAFEVADQPGHFIVVADRWTSGNISDSRYVWLPLQIKDGRPEIHWFDQWDLSVFANFL